MSDGNHMDPLGHMTPLGRMGSIQSPVTGAHSRSRTKAEREMADAAPLPGEPMPQGGGDNEVGELKAKIEALEQKLDNLQGRNGLRVENGIITLSPKAAKLDTGNQTAADDSGGEVEIYCVFNGGKTLVRFGNATVVL